VSNVVGRQGWRHRLLSVSTVATLGLAAIGLGTIGLAGCAAGSTAGANPTPMPSASATFMVKDPWVKTVASGMTAAFGTLVNNTDKDITVVSASSATSSRLELHEVVEVNGAMVMRPKKGGFVVPAHGQHVLAPGGDHIMLMDVKQAVKPGTQVTFTLTFADGSTAQFTAVAKDFAGGKETYAPSMSPMAGMG
jgi:copper(I)-binding protein